MSETAPSPEESPVLDQERLTALLRSMEARQNLPMAVLAGALASVAGAGLWAFVTMLTGYQIGWMAIGVGFLVGWAVRLAGRGGAMVFGVVGAAFALLGCLLGNFLSLVDGVGAIEGLGFFETLGLLDYAMVPELMAATFHPMDLLFYALAVYAGYKFSFERIDVDQFAVSGG